MIISHRGNDNHKFKENTKEAIINVLEKNYVDGVEFDIRLTKDKRLVLNHGFLHDGKIIKYSYFKDLNLDSLNSVLKNIKCDKLILIEIKDEDENIIDLIYKCIKKYKGLNIYIHTFHRKVASLFKKKYPNIKIGIILFNLSTDYSEYDFVSLNYLGYKKNDKLTFLWTVNKENKKFKGLNIITDKPSLLK